MNWVRLFTDTIPRIKIQYTKYSPIGFDSFIETAWAFFCNSGIISPRQQTAAQKPFYETGSRSIWSNDSSTFQKLCVVLTTPEGNKPLLLRCVCSSIYLSSCPTISHRIQSLVTGKKVSAAICSIVYS